MTNAVAKPMNFGLARWKTRRNVPVVLALKKPGRQLPAVSVHVPVTLEHRSRLRVMRDTELAAWNAGFGTGYIERTRTEEKERRDLRAFGLIATLALTTVTISLLKSSSVAEGWAGFVSFVHQLLG